MTYDNLVAFLGSKNATFFLYKMMSQNDNSKQQIYLGGSYDALQYIPYGEITAHTGGVLPNFKAKIDFWWLSDNGNIEKAPRAQLILYPKYPEVRLSGFLSGCKSAPSKDLQPVPKNQRMSGKDGRVLIMAPVGDSVIAYLAPKDSEIANYLSSKANDDDLIAIEYLHPSTDTQQELIDRLKIEYSKNPHALVRLYSDGIIRPYAAKNAAGYTLEASFGIIPNGKAEPDFKGWELKCYNKNVITLMTPEPDGGLYKEMGTRDFVLKYGHLAERGMYFTGPYTAKPNNNFGIPRKLVVSGYNDTTGKIDEVDGAIILLEEDKELAKWSFTHILSHWSNKHNQACYVRYNKNDEGLINYLPTVTLGIGTSPLYLLHAVATCMIYYDPGSRVNNKGELKARSQFRIKDKDLSAIYNTVSIIDISKS